jgi:serine/threonine-protein phosphatase 2A regulatory subunit B
MDTIGQGKENKNTNTSQATTAPPLNELKILEWRYNQFLGEKLTEADLGEEENQSYIISDMKMTDNGEFLAVGDRGGRVIIFQRTESKKHKNTSKLNYFYEYSAFDRDFDVHKSTEYSEVIRSICVLPTQYHDKIDIVSCGYRTIKLHRVYNSKIKYFSSSKDRELSGDDSIDTCEHSYSMSDRSSGAGSSNNLNNLNNKNCNTQNSSNLQIPTLKSVKKDVASKCKKTFKIENSAELNSISFNKFFTNQFISSDESKILLWDVNYSKDVYNVVDLESTGDNISNININTSTSTDMNSESEDTPEPENESKFYSEDNPEKITKSFIIPHNPHLISYGTSYGNIKICDLRVGSDCLKATAKYVDEFQNITNSSFNLTKTLFSSQIMAVHDLNFNLYNENLFASRHFLSVNIWDQRNTKQPMNKFLVYEPIISKLSHLYIKNYLANDKFSLSTDPKGKFILTGGYNNMFHVFDIEQKFNTQITVDGTNEKLMNTNIIRKINSKGSCFYKKDDQSASNINFDAKITKHCFHPKENFLTLAVQNCIYSYNGNVIKKEAPAPVKK